MKLKSIKNCKICGKEYDKDFFGAGPKYCSRECFNRRHRKHLSIYVKKNKDCLICGRNIAKVGLRKNTYKYCSKRCMVLAQSMRHRDTKYTLIKIPISELPRLFKS